MVSCETDHYKMVSCETDNEMVSCETDNKMVDCERDNKIISCSSHLTIYHHLPSHLSPVDIIGQKVFFNIL